jgi:tRNA pseudouridine38-40 synthase
MSRFFIHIAYNGTRYHGWQSQPNAVTVQATIEKALSTLLQTPTAIIGAGRTDAGVHAKEMYAHLDIEVYFERKGLVNKLNSLLPKDIMIYDILPVHDEAHARFDATSRSYEYKIHTYKDIFTDDMSWQFDLPLDIEKMNEAAKILLEYNDFQCFSKTHTDVHTFNCIISQAHWEKNEQSYIFHITADRFLRNMVRAIVGTLIQIGLGKKEVVEMHDIIQSKNRSRAGFSVPAKGLYLTEIVYPYLKKLI